MAENDFVIWAPASGANIYPVVTYRDLPAISNGIVNGVADATAANNAWRQGTSVAAMVGAFIAAAGLNALDDGNTSELLGNFTASLQMLFRIKLTANLNLYVSPTGSDTNTGLSSGSPFLTLQKAWNTVISNYDLAGFTVTINVANGTYTSPIFCVGIPTGAIGGVQNNPNEPSIPITFLGNPTTPDNVIINVTAGCCFFVGNGANVKINGFKLAATGSGADYNQNGVALYGFVGAGISFQNIDFSTCSQAHILASTGSTIESVGNAYTISGGANAHVLAFVNAYVALADSAVTLTGTPNFTGAFANANSCGVVYAANMTFSGTATGSRYLATINGVINTASGNANYFPGNAAGSYSSGGQYA